MRPFHSKQLLIQTVAILLAYSAVFGQAKVGTTKAPFLDLPFSAQSSALGWSGVTLIDEQSAFNNPGALGLFYSDRQANLSLLVPHKLNAGITLYNGSIGYRLLSKKSPGANRLIVAVAYNYIGLKTGWMPVRKYEQGTLDDTGSKFQASDRAQTLSAGIAWEGTTRIGLGLGVMWIDERYVNQSASTVAANLGLIVERPFELGRAESDRPHYRLTPTFGLAFLNMGPDLKMIEENYPLPRRMNIGFSFTLERMKNDISTISARLISERSYDIVNQASHLWHLGAELGFYEALYFRVGYHDGDIPSTTYGLGTNLGGLINTLVRWEIMENNSSLARLSETLEISYNYGNLNSWLLGYNGYHQISIALK